MSEDTPNKDILDKQFPTEVEEIPSLFNEDGSYSEMANSIRMAFSLMVKEFIDDACQEHSVDEVRSIIQTDLDTIFAKHKGGIPVTLETRFPVEYRIKPLPIEGRITTDLLPDYDAVSAVGTMSIENIPEVFNDEVLLGLNIIKGKLWLCINGMAFIRFNPHLSNYKRGNG